MSSEQLALDTRRLQASLMRWMTADVNRGLVATDRQFRVTLWNRWMEVHSGRLAADVLGRDLFEVCPDAAPRGIKDYYDDALLGRVAVVSHGLHRFILAMAPTRADLTFRDMPQSGQIGPLMDDDQIVGTITILEDVSERLSSEAELRKQIEAQQLARATAEKALRAKDEFLSTLSHEIRTPLNAVLGWARILLTRETIEPEFLTRAVQVIERNAAAQAKMIDDLLDMARIVAGKLRVEMQPVDLLGVVLSAIDVVRPSTHAKNITVRTAIDPKTPRVLGDQDRLQQVVWNLLSNAVKFTEPGGSIEVRLHDAGKSARIEVADSGQGISPEFLPYVFERFRQNDASSSRRQGGLGLGLALVRELVELHGGTVFAHSDGLNKGTTMTISLPSLMSPEIRHSHGGTAPVEKADPQSLAGVRVMVVEDESDARELTVTTLSSCGATVTSAASSAEAITVLLGAPPDLRPQVIVSDIGMPRKDGYDLIRQIRALDSPVGQIPAVTLTGYATPEDVDRALEAGFQAHIAKPINPASLISMVRKLAQEKS
jgi:signal transduction histidine kinase/ActR/RegA family two-component response regulator